MKSQCFPGHEVEDTDSYSDFSDDDRRDVSRTDRPFLAPVMNLLSALVTSSENPHIER